MFSKKQHGMFMRHGRLIYAVIMLLLAFYAVAVVHESIPGLCTLFDGDDEECAFCSLVYTLAIALCLCLYFLLRRERQTVALLPYAVFGSQRIWPAFSLRGPPLHRHI